MNLNDFLRTPAKIEVCLVLRQVQSIYLVVDVDVEIRLSPRILEIALIRPTKIGQYSRL